MQLFMNDVDFFQNGCAGWKHARRSDCGGWNVYGLVKLFLSLSANGAAASRRVG